MYICCAGLGVSIIILIVLYKCTTTIVISCYVNFKVHSTVLVKNNTAISQEKIHTTVALLNSQSFCQDCKLFTTVIIPKCNKSTTLG